MIGLPTPTRDAEFADFVNAASPSLSGTAYLLTGDRDAAADLVRETLIRTYLAWRKVRHGDAMTSARRTLVNLYVERWRGRRPDPPRQKGGAHRRSEPTVDDSDELVSMLAELPSQQRLVLVLRYFNDLPDGELAELFGISLGAVASAASRGLASQYVPAPGHLTQLEERFRAELQQVPSAVRLDLGVATNALVAAGQRLRRCRILRRAASLIAVGITVALLSFAAISHRTVGGVPEPALAPRSLEVAAAHAVAPAAGQPSGTPLRSTRCWLTREAPCSDHPPPGRTRSTPRSCARRPGHSPAPPGCSQGTPTSRPSWSRKRW
ncbi:MAG TPA: SigE family RNA polymerase sigma factor [Propionicimonas sp.]|jgi:RNA polymerase sigma-70 factor (sigma-E family)